MTRRKHAFSLLAPAAFSLAAVSSLPFFAMPAQGAPRAAASTRGGAKAAVKPRAAAPRPAARPRPAPLPPIQMSQPNTSGPRAEFGADKQILRPSGVRLEGNAFIRRPELDARADAVALDYNEKNITQVRAVGNVYFRVDLPPKAGTSAKPVRVEARAAKATLDPNTRVVTLEGNVDGYYQVEGGGKNLLSGDRVTIRQVGDQYVSSVQGNVRVVLPAETLSPSSENGGNSQNLGAVTITAERTEIDQKTGVVTFSGNARARSEGGASGFDVAAPSFTLTRGASGTIDTLKTSGKTLIKIDLPPEPPRAGVPAPAAGASTAARPTHVEAIADSATVLRGADNTLILEGNVEGFYRLQAAGAAAADYRFNGDRAVIKYAKPTTTTATATSPLPAGLQVEVTGKPSAIQAPAFGLGF